MEGVDTILRDGQKAAGCPAEDLFLIGLAAVEAKTDVHGIQRLDGVGDHRLSMVTGMQVRKILLFWLENIGLSFVFSTLS